MKTALRGPPTLEELSISIATWPRSILSSQMKLHTGGGGRGRTLSSTETNLNEESVASGLAMEIGFLMYTCFLNLTYRVSHLDRTSMK